MRRPLLILGVLFLAACHDDDDHKRDPLFCAPCRGQGETRTYQTPVSLETIEAERLCFPEENRPSLTCWYGCHDPFPKAAQCPPENDKENDR